MLKIYITLFLFIFSNLSAEVIKKLEVNGNSRISEETIKVYGGITIGKDYSAFDLNEILKNLYGTLFFEDIRVAINNGVLEINVREYSVINSIFLDGEKSKQVKQKILEKLNLKEKESFIQNKLSQDINLIKKLYASIGFNFADVKAKIERFDENRVNLIYSFYFTFLER